MDVSYRQTLLLLLLLGVLGVTSAAPGAATAKAGTQHTDSAEIASQIETLNPYNDNDVLTVQQLQTLNNHKFPGGHAARSAALQAMPSSMHYETASYYDPYTQDYVVQGPEPTQEPSGLTPSGINENGALGFISYLVLLVLLQGAVEGVAARAPTHRRKRDLRPTEDLAGRALDYLEVLDQLTGSHPEEFAMLPSSVLATLQKEAGTKAKKLRQIRRHS